MKRRVVNVAFRLPAAKHRALKVALAKNGVSLQQALEHAVDELIAARRPAEPEDLRGFLRDAPLMEIREDDRRRELEKEQRWIEALSSTRG